MEINKMKVFISQPMRGKTKEEVSALREEAKVKFMELYKGGEEVEFISSYMNGDGEALSPLYLLSRSIQMICDCDAVLFVGDWKNARGCRSEHYLCEQYEITIYEIEK